VLHRIEAYDFFYDTALPSILERSGLDVARAPSSLGLSAEGLSAKMRRIIPPEALELQVRTAVEGVVPYLTGSTDSFEITLAPGRWVEEGAEVIRDLVREPELYDYLLDHLVRAPLQPQWSAFESSIPFPLELTSTWWRRESRLFGPGWPSKPTPLRWPPLRDGKTELQRHHPARRGWRGIQVLRNCKSSRAGYDFLVRGQGIPRLRPILTSSLRLPYGVSFSDDELGTIIALVLPRDWVEAQLDRGIDALAGSFTGRARSGAFSIPLADRADAASLLLAAAVNVKGRAAYDGLSECTAIEEQALGAIPEVMPSCRIPGLDYDDVRARVGFDPAVMLRSAFAARLPESIDVTEEDLRAAFQRPEDGITLGALRDTVIDGYSFDVPGLRRLLEAASTPDRRGASWERFQGLRLRLRDGIRFTEADLRRATDEEARAALDRTRWWLGFARRALVVLAVAVVLLLVGIARLGGRSRESRLIWGGWALLRGGSAVAGVAFGIEALRGLATPAVEGLQAERGLTDKLLELRDELFNTFTGVLGVQGIVVALAGLALLFWGVWCIGRARGGGDEASEAI
jgi:hypothetical protein